MSQGFKDLKVYKLAYEAAMKIFEISKSFPNTRWNGPSS